jgi:hypothetical protein
MINYVIYLCIKRFESDVFLHIYQFLRINLCLSRLLKTKIKDEEIFYDVVIILSWQDLRYTKKREKAS